MSHSYTPADLHDSDKFELIEEVAYKDLKPFIMRTIQNQFKWLKIYGIIQLVSLFLMIGILSFMITLSVDSKVMSDSLKWYLAGIAFSFTILIPIHELLHALGFLIMGKRDIGFGMQLRKFIFYAEANNQVIDKKQMTVVAMAPFVVVFIVSLSAFFMLLGNPVSMLFLAIFLLHFLFCAGDVAMLAYFNSQKGLYSYDSRSEKKSYFFVKRID